MSSRWLKRHRSSRPDDFVRPGVSAGFWRGMLFTAVIYAVTGLLVLVLVRWAR